MRAHYAGDDYQLAPGVRLRELLDVAGLVLEVELDQHRLAELADDSRRSVDAGLFDHPFEKARQVEEQVGVRPDLLFDPRSLHLDHHALAVADPGAMHLRDRGGRERLRIDVREQLGGGPPEPLLDQAKHRFQ